MPELVFIFMENASFFYARNTLSQSTGLLMSPYAEASLSQIHTCHKNKEIGKLLLNQQMQSEGWQQNFCDKFIRKVLSQLENMDEKRCELLSFSVHLGNFYIVNGETYFDKHQKTVTCVDIETAINNNNTHRKYDHADRPDYKSKPDAICERPTSIHQATRGILHETNRKLKKNILCGFWSNLPSIGDVDVSLSSITSADVETINAEEVIRNAFGDLGYSEHLLKEPEEQSDAKITGTNLWCGSAWKVSIQPSASYQVHARLDTQLNVISVHERLLNWVSGTLLGNHELDSTHGSTTCSLGIPLGDNPTSNQSSSSTKDSDLTISQASSSLCDVRFKIGDEKPVEKGTDLYNHFVPMALVLLHL